MGINKHLKLVFLFLVLFVLLCVSCSGGRAPTSTATIFASPTTTVSVTKVIPSATEPMLLETATPTITPSPTPTPLLPITPNLPPLNNIEQRCPEILTDFSQNEMGDKVIVWEDLSQRDENVNHPILLFDGTSFVSFTEIPPIYFRGYVSPDGKWLAYEQSGERYIDSIIIANMQGDVLVNRQEGKNWGYLDGWIDKEHIRFIDADINSRIDIVVLNPFQWKARKIKGNFPNLYKSLSEDKWWFAWKSSYSPLGRIVAYPEGKKEDGDLNHLVLWDFIEKKEIWRLDKYSTRWTKPVWSPDGQKMAVVALNQGEDNYDRFEMFIVHPDGVAKQLIDAKGLFPNLLAGGELHWSPDNKYISFTGNGFFPLIVNTEFEEAYTYCFRGGEESSIAYVPFLWSPDGDQLLMKTQNGPYLVVDMKRNLAFQVKSNADLYPVGWLYLYSH